MLNPSLREPWRQAQRHPRAPPVDSLIRARRLGKLSDYRAFCLVATRAAIYGLRVPDAAGLKEKFDVAAVMGDPDGSRWNLSHGQTSSWRVGGKPLALRFADDGEGFALLLRGRVTL